MDDISTDLPKITPEEAEILRDFLDHPGWRIYKYRLLSAQVTVLRQAIDIELSAEKRAFAAGGFYGLKRAEVLPRLILAVERSPIALPEIPDEDPGPEEVSEL